MPGFYEKYGGAVISITINKYFCSFYNPREEEKIKMISSDVQSRHSLDVFYRMKFGNGFVISKLLVGSDLCR